jgi:hypothetical protein
MSDVIGIILTKRESDMLLKALLDCQGATQQEEEDLNAVYRRVTEAQDWAQAFNRGT